MMVPRVSLFASIAALLSLALSMTLGTRGGSSSPSSGSSTGSSSGSSSSSSQPQSSLSGQQSIVSAGNTRTFYYYQPQNFDPSQGLLIYLHGGGSNGYNSATRGTDNLFLLLADRVGVLVLFPDGKPYNNNAEKATWNDCTDNVNTGSVAYTDWDDVQFIKDLIPWVTTNINGDVDTTRVYAAGESEGGQMVERLALEANDVIAAAANAAGNLPVANDNSPDGTYKCQGYTAPYTPGSGEAVPMFLFKGDADPRIPFGATTGYDHDWYCQVRDPYYGDSPSASHPYCEDGAVHSYFDTLAFWEWKMGISPVEDQRVPGTYSENYPDTVPDCTDTSDLAGCDGSTVLRHDLGNAPYTVVFDRVLGGGHAFPGPRVQSQTSLTNNGWKNRDQLGGQYPYIAEEMWEFFTQWTLAD